MPCDAFFVKVEGPEDMLPEKVVKFAVKLPTEYTPGTPYAKFPVRVLFVRLMPPREIAAPPR